MKTKIILLTGIALLFATTIKAESTLKIQDETPADSISNVQEIDTLSQNSVDMDAPEKEVSQNGDTTFISFGNKKIQIIEGEGQTDVKIKDKNKDAEDEEIYDYSFNDDEDEEEHEKAWKNFKGHWSGFEFGLCNYMNSDNSFNRSEENSFMDITTSRSWNFNLNFAQHSMGLGTDKVGLVTGMGIEWNNYHFSGDSTIGINDDGIIDAIATDAATTKNRLQTTYVTFPLLLEFQFTNKKSKDRPYLGVGVIGGVRLFSNVKLKYDERGSKKKTKGNYNLHPLRYAFTARLGFKSFKLYANYSPMALFQDDKGPELYPVAGGLVVSF